MKRCALVAGGLVVGVVLMESAARVVGLTPHYGHLMSLDGAPTRTVDGVVLWSHKRPRHTDEDVRRVAANSDAFTILGLGDSIMYGVWQDREQTYLEVAKRVLAARADRPVEVLNLAVPGFNTRQENAVYEELESQLRPDLVIVHYWVNDSRQYRVVGGHVVDYGDVSDDGRFVVRALPLPPGLSDWLLLNSRLYDLVTQRAAARERAAEPTNWDVVVGTPLLEIAARARRAGGRLLILVSPELTGATPAPVVDLDRLRQLGQEHGIQLVDLSQWLAGTESAAVALEDRVHFNTQGHRIVGERLAEALLQQDLKPTR